MVLINHKKGKDIINPKLDNSTGICIIKINSKAKRCAR